MQHKNFKQLVLQCTCPVSFEHAEKRNIITETNSEEALKNENNIVVRFLVCFFFCNVFYMNEHMEIIVCLG